jgi:ComF family protein
VWWWAQFRLVVGWLVDGLYPRFCCICDKAGDFVCEDCDKSIIHRQEQRCLVCKKIKFGGRCCGYCKKLSGINRWISASSLSVGPLRQLVHQFKYENRRVLVEYLGELMTTAIESQLVGDKDWQIVFVPMSWQGLWQRPYNQSALLAEYVSHRFGWPILAVLTKQHRHRQVDLSGMQRRRNLQGAFKAKWPLLGQSIVLVDDVVTTGSTVTHAAKALREAGAKEVIVVSLA